ncbi:TPA: hypothetical protein ACQDGJ_003069, partial [Legionella pneumophila]
EKFAISLLVHQMNRLLESIFKPCYRRFKSKLRSIKSRYFLLNQSDTIKIRRNLNKLFIVFIKHLI